MFYYRAWYNIVISRFYYVQKLNVNSHLNFIYEKLFFDNQFVLKPIMPPLLYCHFKIIGDIVVDINFIKVGLGGEKIIEFFWRPFKKMFEKIKIRYANYLILKNCKSLSLKEHDFIMREFVNKKLTKARFSDGNYLVNILESKGIICRFIFPGNKYVLSDVARDYFYNNI